MPNTETQPTPQGQTSKKWWEVFFEGIGIGFGGAINRLLYPNSQANTSGNDGKPTDNTMLYIIIGSVVVFMIILIIMLKK